jgi:putative PIG3 family NAD(P)H quinone oxidoreductase
LPIPQGFDFAQAAALPETLFTVWANLIDRGRLKAGEYVLIHGGSSGIGYMAIQLARENGATVYTTVGNEAKAEFCRSLGAAVAINYRTEDFVAVVEKATSRRGVDVILDMVGRDYLGRNIRSLALEGRLIQIAFLQGSTVQQFDFMPVMTRRLTITGSTLRPRSIEEKAAIAQSLRQHVWPLLESGKIKVVIDRIIPLSRASDAQRVMEESQHMGKILLQVR